MNQAIPPTYFPGPRQAMPVAKTEDQRIEALTKSFIERGVSPLTARYWATCEVQMEASD